MATKKTNKANIVDIDLSVTKKKQFRIDKDDNRIIELNTSDTNILSRLQKVYPRLDELSEKASVLGEDADADIKVLKEMDEELRKCIDYLFDSDVSSVCAPFGSMFDLFNGQFRFEHILEALFPLYENNIDDEYGKLTKRMSKHTDKYIK